ncbi:flagellar hook assembly protein FlgD [Falsiroseomonas selenitidurans]|uniref:Basal-body rod modification protein FlgD n=1 Tax=Falsiroseomonas selenitidurans TaxID=2716335 RepID=A0ABX1E9T0_9PROT|nr:flagellar hook assembly protein FlgD [Falsiroseomonas selenitidurans]NKC33995.1 flagellar hook assembly protein FlgD [Falsiroseomonas selenitidurans]
MSSTIAGTATTGTGQAATAAQSLAGDMQSFLRLLTTQLQNQDPTQPMDANQFTQQLAQFAGVEQQIATNQHMETLLGLQRASALVAATPMVGRQAEVASTRLTLSAGQTQEVRLPALADANGANRARIVVTDSTGATLREAVVPLGTAATAWRWDGKDARGNAVNDGSYTFAVTGIDQEGGARGVLPGLVAGTITGVSQDGSAVQIAVGGLTADMDALRRLQ